MSNINIKQAPLFQYLFSSTQFAWVWLVVRLVIGYEWFNAGWEKLFSPFWVGENAGEALTKFLQGAILKTGGAHPDVSNWYGLFLERMALPNAHFLSYVVTYGELLVGMALIFGLFTGISAFFGAFMNINYLMAGTISINPEMLVIEFF